MKPISLPWKIGVIALSLFASASGQNASANNPGLAPAPKPSPESGPAYPLTAIAAIGSAFAQSYNLADLGWTEDQMAAFIEGVSATLHGKGYPLDDTARKLIAEMGKRAQDADERKKKQAAAAFAQPGRLEQYMKEMRKRYSLQVSDSGLAYTIQPGRAGVRPRPGDTVVVSCMAMAADAATSLPQLSNDHARVKLEGLLPGLMEGIQMMTVESQMRLILPPDLSFGEGTWPEGVDRGTPILFFVTLHEVISAEAAP